MSNINFVENLILVRNEPHIYAFSTNTIPNYLKIGDTFRPVNIRIEEWNKKISDALGSDVDVRLTKEYSETAVIDDVYFRDYSVHQFLEDILKKQSIVDTEPELASMYSREFFKDVTVADVEAAIADIREEYHSDDPNKNYTYYKLAEKKPSSFHWNHDQPWKLRPNQKDVVSKFLSKQDEKELLMYAVMRFGKSFTAMCCALESNAKKVLIVSAKADVATEWKATVEKPECFKDYQFLVDTDFVSDKNAIQKHLDNGKNVAVFLTLQNLTGKDKDNKNIKNKLTEVFATEYDLIIVDETHFGAWAKSYGSALKDEEDSKSVKDDLKLLKKFEESHSALKTQKKLHLSGTPYNLLYDKTFSTENMIASVQFSDILNEKEAWDTKHFEDIENGNINPDTGKPYQEFDNPYFGFPQMLRFAFNPPAETRAKLSALSQDGKWTLTEMFRAENGEFVHSEDVLKLLKIMDGRESDESILSFLDIPKVKEHDVCKHMVFVLPYKSSCDAMEKLLTDHQEEFANLSQYKVLNVAGHKAPTELATVEKVKAKIESYEKELQKTVTLTVNKMLTGVTVREWDTMIMLKNTHSAQEYDQAVFRIQNQYVIDYEAADGSVIKKDMKPQTILVDFDPMRIFEIQGTSANIVSEVSEKKESFETALSTELKFFPIITYNGTGLVKVEPNNIVEIITQYNNQKSILEEASAIKLDTDILSDEYISTFIKAQSKLGLTNSLTADAHYGEDTDLEVPADEDNDSANPSTSSEETAHSSDDGAEKLDKDIEKKFRMCMANILFYVFLSNSKIERLSDILISLNDPQEGERNRRIFNHLSLDAKFINALTINCSTHFAIGINNKIKNANLLSNDSTLSPEKRASNALDRFSRISDSEIVTPRWICSEMLESIGIEELAKLVENGGKILDIASKTGEFAYSIFTALKDIVDIEKLKGCIYAVPTSGVTYEFTRRMYETLGLKLKNLVSVDNFNAYELIEKAENSDIDYTKIAALLRQNKPFDSITLDDEITEGDEAVNFDVIIGNPPYQLSTSQHSAQGKPIYDKFVEISKHIEPKFVSMIIPSRWFAGGLGLDSFRDKMKSDSCISKMVSYANGKDCFPDASTGGICYFLRNSSWNGKCQFTSVINGVRNRGERDLSEFPVVLRDNVAQKIVQRMKTYAQTPLSEKVCSINVFGFESKRRGEPTPFEDGYALLSSKGFGYIPKEALKQGKDLADKYKVIVGQVISEHAAEPDKNGQYKLLSSLRVLEPKQICNFSYLVVNTFATEQEALNFKQYLSTRFVRYLILQAVSSIHLTKDKFSFVPVQDFSRVWTDADLYAKYELTEEEIAFIESVIKPME